MPEQEKACTCCGGCGNERVHAELKRLTTETTELLKLFHGIKADDNNACFLEWRPGEIWPVYVGESVSLLQITIMTMERDLDLSTWVPGSLLNGALVSVKKGDSSKHRITFYDDQISFNYRYINKQGETMLFGYSKDLNKLRKL